MTNLGREFVWRELRIELVELTTKTAVAPTSTQNHRNYREFLWFSVRRFLLVANARGPGKSWRRYFDTR